MKKHLLFSIIFLFSLATIAQVGIGTENPTSMLDVNGSMRVRKLSSDADHLRATKVLGLDDQGNFIELTLGDNIIIERNHIRAVNTTLEFGDIPTVSARRVRDMIVFPGSGDRGRSIIRIENVETGVTTEITGIAGGYDGAHIWLYPTNGDLKLIPNSNESAPENRIGENDKMNANQYEMLELVYDSKRKLWVVMQNHH